MVKWEEGGWDMLHISFAWDGATVRYKRDFVPLEQTHLLRGVSYNFDISKIN
jgi:hypothetical protein